MQRLIMKTLHYTSLLLRQLQQADARLSPLVTSLFRPLLQNGSICSRTSHGSYRSLHKQKSLPLCRDVTRMYSNRVLDRLYTTRSSVIASKILSNFNDIRTFSSLTRNGRIICSSFVTPSMWPHKFINVSSSCSSAPSSFLKNQSPLMVKRPLRKKILKIYDEGKTLQVDNVVGYAVAEEIKLGSLKAMLLKQGLYTIGELPTDLEKVLHVRGKYNMDKKPKEIFVFEDGSVVFWCVPEIERGAFLKVLGKHSQAPYQTSLVLYEREEIDFVNTKGKTTLLGEVIQLAEGDQDSMEKLLELYTISNALGQSVKLALWEASLDKYVTSIVTVTEDLRHGRKIGMSRRQVLMKTGELFSLKHLINLSSDLLDTPDFYWERSTLEPLYLSMSNHLNMARRTRVMNEKLSHCCELTELLSTELNDKHHTRLEVMIIILILLEVMFEIIHFGERYISFGGENVESTDEVQHEREVKDSRIRRADKS